MNRTAYGKALPHAQRGVSLYQTIVTLAVAGVLGTLVVPNLQPVLSNQRMTTSVNTLLTALHLTRSEAIHHRQRAALCPTQDGQTCLDSYSEWHRGFMLYIDLNANRERDGEEPVVRLFETNRGIQLRSSRGRDHITYQANGLASGSNATFVFCDTAKKTRARTVIVANSGRPRVLPARDNRACG
jgi:type IV fimbrial biogenesis protein FimT